MKVSDMGDSATSTALAKRDASNALMPPPPPSKRVKRPPKVLDEDTYTTALEYIIARDFYPGLLETKTLSDYLDALETGDETYIAEKERVARTVMNTPRVAIGTPRTRRQGLGDMTPLNLAGQTPGHLSVVNTPRTISTPARQEREERGLKDRAGNAVDLNLNLADFQARYTSEDNESFYKLVDRQNFKKAAERAWYWSGNKLPSKRQIAQAAVHQQQQQQPAIAGAESTALVKVPRPSENPDERPAGITARLQHTNQGPKNSLMFMPDGIADTHPGLTSTVEKSQQRSNAPPKLVSYTNTRLVSGSTGIRMDGEGSIPPSPSLSAIDAAIRGAPVPRRASTLAPSSIMPDHEEDEPGQGGYAYVDAEPTPSEVAAFAHGPPKPTAPKSLLAEMVEANQSRSSANAFTISAPSKREEIRDKLVDKNLASRRAPLSHLRSSDRVSALGSDRVSTLANDRTTALRGETPRFISSPRPGQTPSRSKGSETLTPAGRKLFDTLGKTPTNRSKTASGGRSAFDESAGKAAWTPTPLRVKKNAK